jgi:cystathionine beta-lyase
MADFDRVISRTDTRCVKWDGRESAFGDKDVLPMWVADMDFLSPSPVVEALVRRAQHGVFGYTIAPPSYYHAITDWLHRRHHWTVDPAWILFSPGVVTALSLAVQAFTEPGDKVLLQAPVYHPFYDVIKRHNRVIVNNPLKMENGRYTMDFDDLERCADEGIKMMLLCSPHNPVGRVWSQSELLRLGEFCRERGILVISDEIHSDLVYRPHVHTPFASIS